MGLVGIPSILTAIRQDYKAGSITLREAAEELLEAGWMNYVDEGKALRLIEMEEEKMSGNKREETVTISFDSISRVDRIAHIEDDGAITWFVEPDSLSDELRESIETMALEQRARYLVDSYAGEEGETDG